MKPVYLYVGEKQEYLCTVGMEDVTFQDVSIGIGPLSSPADGRIFINIPNNAWMRLYILMVPSTDVSVGTPEQFKPFDLIMDTQGSLVRLDCRYTNIRIPLDSFDGNIKVMVELDFLAHPKFFTEFYDLWRAEKLARMEIKNA